jgi:hypothetical protein
MDMSALLKPVSDEVGMTRDFGAFLGRVLVDPLADDAEAAWREKVRVWRAKNAFLFQDKYEQFVRDRRLEGKTAPAPLAIAWPILEHAVLEEDDSLLDLWANLFVTLTDPARHAEVKRGYIYLIKQLDAVDVAVLSMLHRNYLGLIAKRRHDAESRGEGFFHPRNAAVLGSAIQKTLGAPELTTEVALENVGRLKLTSTTADILGQQVSLSLLGLKLMDACSGKPTELALTR